MTEYVFRASDSDTAMEKAIRELGDDAMIISVKRVGDVTEVRATKEASIISQPLWENPLSQSLPSEAMDLSAAMRKARTNRNEPEPKVEMEFNTGPDNSLGLGSDQILNTAQLEEMFHERLATAQANTTLNANIQPESVVEQSNPLPAEPIQQIVPLPEMEPSNSDHTLNISEQVSKTAAQADLNVQKQFLDHQRETIFGYGFPEDIAQICAVAPNLHTHLAQRDHACALLAKRLVSDADTSVVYEDTTLFVFGPPGAGKTTVAAQLAFERLQNTAFRPRFIQIAQKGFVTHSQLKGYAKLLNSEFRCLSLNDEQEISHTDIIDCDLSEHSTIIEALERVTVQNTQGRITPIMVIPGTWSVAAIKQYSLIFKALAPAVILTHMNIGGIAISGLSALAEAGVKLIAANDTNKITDGLILVDIASTEQFLKETFTASAKPAGY
jgi:flagellar biosynthesis GTPase FlhF